MSTELLKRADASWFARQFQKHYASASDDIRNVILDMSAIVVDEEASEDERRDALETLVEAMFPTGEYESVIPSEG